MWNTGTEEKEIRQPQGHQRELCRSCGPLAKISKYAALPLLDTWSRTVSFFGLNKVRLQNDRSYAILRHDIKLHCLTSPIRSLSFHVFTRGCLNPCRFRCVSCSHRPKFMFRWRSGRIESHLDGRTWHAASWFHHAPGHASPLCWVFLQGLLRSSLRNSCGPGFTPSLAACWNSYSVVFQGVWEL